MNDLTQKLVFALVIVPVLIGIFRTRTEMGLSIVAIASALFFVNLDKFTRFKTPGFEAELRTVVNKAYAAIEELKELGVSLSAPIIDDLAMSGRIFQYIPLRFKLERVEKIAATLKALGASQAEIDSVTDTIYVRVNGDHVNKILYTLRSIIPEKVKLFDGLDDGKMANWDKTKVEEFITSNGLTRNEEVEEGFSDLDFFLKNKKLRRPDKWQS